jgi:hypothetical protein
MKLLQVTVEELQKRVISSFSSKNYQYEDANNLIDSLSISMFQENIPPHKQIEESYHQRNGSSKVIKMLKGGGGKEINYEQNQFYSRNQALLATHKHQN